MEIRVNKLEHGQSLVLIAITMVGMIAVAALAIDGGQTYANRRMAQAAADAGALAGAYERCEGATVDEATAAAISYAVDSANGATSATATISGSDVTVNVIVAQTSFLAQIINFNQVNVQASASADCLIPNAALGDILPLGATCSPPEPGSDSPDCDIDSYEWNEFKRLTDPDATGSTTITGEGTVSLPFDFSTDMLSDIVIIMESTDITSDPALLCYDDPDNLAGTLICDLDGDGDIDVLGGGDRSWLDLDGAGGGSSSLDGWIEDGFNNVIEVHFWLESQTGVQVSTFFAVENFAKGEVFQVPVFNAYCDGPPDTQAGCMVADAGHDPVLDPNPDTIIWGGGLGAEYYHIIGFGTFFISCVEAASAGPCPGHAAGFKADVFPNNEKTIEGYFISGFPPFPSSYVTSLGSAGGAADLGNHFISLTK